MTLSPTELWYRAGKPDRAVIKLSQPTKVWTGLRRSSIVSEFEAFLQEGNVSGVGYYINPKSYRVFYMPENVIEIIPVDTMELWYRAKKAANYLKTGATNERQLDNAFENYDGSEMCAALYRMAQKSKKLESALKKLWGENYTSTIEKHALEFAHLSNAELSEHAKATRESKGNS